MEQDRERTSSWKLIETFLRGEAKAEVSMLDGYQPKYSVRIGWKDTKREGAWFPYREESNHAQDIAAVAKEAEVYVLDKIGEFIKKQNDDLAVMKQKADEKKKRYEDNVERRKQENRDRTRAGKGGR